MIIRFIEEAKYEFLNAIAYYEGQRPGLGRRFKDEIDRSVIWLGAHPEACWLRPGGYRRLNL
jgi:hypothetical protein